MASGKETPRQKMINLMYLVFIAMLALNMSKEVLTTFGEIDAKVKKSTVDIKAKNASDLDDLEKDAQKDASTWAEAYGIVSQISDLVEDLDNYIKRYLLPNPDFLLVYDAIEQIDWPEGFYRSDIGWQALKLPASPVKTGAL